MHLSSGVWKRLGQWCNGAAFGALVTAGANALFAGGDAGTGVAVGGVFLVAGGLAGIIAGRASRRVGVKE